MTGDRVIRKVVVTSATVSDRTGYNAISARARGIAVTDSTAAT